MAHLMDAQHKTAGHTVLYIPDEGTTMKLPTVHRNKEFVQRMEGTLLITIPSICARLHTVIVIHWTRQIKELLSSQESQENTVSSGPLQEIEFWRARCEDLSGLTRQLYQPGVDRVTTILRRAKSSYLPPFLKLSQQIQVCQCFNCTLLLFCSFGYPGQSC